MKEVENNIPIYHRLNYYFSFNQITETSRMKDHLKNTSDTLHAPSVWKGIVWNFSRLLIFAPSLTTGGQVEETADVSDF